MRKPWISLQPWLTNEKKWDVIDLRDGKPIGYISILDEGYLPHIFIRDRWMKFTWAEASLEAAAERITRTWTSEWICILEVDDEPYPEDRSTEGQG